MANSGWSPLDGYTDQLEQWASQGMTYTDMAKAITRMGIPTTRASIKRAFKRHNLVKPALTSVPKAVQSVMTERLERAQRAAEDTLTAEDMLRDELEHMREQLRGADQTIKQLRSRQSIDDRIGYIVAESLKDYVYEPILSSPKVLAHSDTDALLLFSDTHFGEVVDPDQALGLVYNPEVARLRIQKLRDEVLELRGGIDGKLLIASLGDQLSGSIHPELEVSNAMAMVDQSKEFARIMFDFAVSLVAEIENVELVIIPGNHPRVHHKPRYKGRFENWESVMAEMVKAFAYPGVDRLSITAPRAFPYVHEFASKRIAMIHGDGIKSNSFAGLPYYGMQQQRNAIQSLMSGTGHARVNMFVMGHWHQPLEWPGVECDIVVNGSVKGADEYSIGTRLAANPAEQVLLEIDPLRPIGSVSKHRIYLGDVR